MTNTKIKLDAIRRNILTVSAMVNEYNWDADFKEKELKSAFTPGEYRLTLDELRKLDRKTLYDYGFGNWDGTMILIPLWLANFIDDCEVISIMGDKKMLSQCDRDVRYGFMAWGFVGNEH